MSYHSFSLMEARVGKRDLEIILKQKKYDNICKRDTKSYEVCIREYYICWGDQERLYGRHGFSCG